MLFLKYILKIFLKPCIFHSKTHVLESFLINLFKLQLFRLKHICFPVKFTKFLRTAFITKHLQSLLLKIHKKSNLCRFFLQCCRLCDSSLNENVFYQKGLNRKFQENTFSKIKFLKSLKEELPNNNSLKLFPVEIIFQL